MTDDDYTLTLRKEKYDEQFSTSISIISNNDYQLSLRKNKLFAYMMSKRIIPPSKTRRITFEEIQYAPNIHTQITLFQSYLYNNDNNNYSSLKLDYIQETLLPKFTSSLCDPNTPIIIKETIVLIFIELSHNHINYFIEVLFLCDIDKELCTITNSHPQYRKLQNLFIALISNILADNAESHLIITNTIDIQNIIKTAYLNAKDTEESRRVVLILIMNLFIYYDDKDKASFIHLVTQIIIPEIKISYTLNQYIIFEQGIDSLNAFGGCDCLIETVISDRGIIGILREALKSYEDKTNIIKILCCLLSGSEEQIMQILSNELIKEINDIIISYASIITKECCSYDKKKLLYGQKGEALIYAIRALTKIICKVDSLEYNNMILSKDALVIKSIIECLRLSDNESIQIELINFFLKHITSKNISVANSLIITHKIHIEIGTVFNDMKTMNQMEHNNTEDIMIKLLQLIESILIFSSNYKFYSCIKEELYNIGFVDLLIQIQFNSQIDSIITKIEDIISIHWNENEVYYSVSNEYLNIR